MLSRTEILTGCLWGCAVGDAIGLPYEGLSVRRARRFAQLPLKHRFVLGRGMVSDDTDHTVFVAQALLRTERDPGRFRTALAWRLRLWLLCLRAGIGAHYDSVIDAPCADDNAAAVAITLAMVERLRETPPTRDVIVAFFDAEEPPYFLSQSMGSIRFVLDQMDARSVGFALIQDLTGHEVSVPFLPQTIAGTVLPRLRNLLFMTGAESHPTLPKLVRDCLPADGVSLIATLNENVGDMSDHHIFRTMGVPYLFFSCGRWEHYHQRSDTPEKLSYSKMARIADFLSGVAHRCASLDLPKAGEHDTTEFEVGLLKETLGMFLPVFLPLVGLKKLETRADLDALAARLAGLGL